MSTMLQRIRNAKSGQSSLTPNANADRIYGSAYVPSNYAIKSEAVDGMGRHIAILAAQVDENVTTNRRGELYAQKRVVGFLAGPDGKASGSYIFIKLRSDSALTPGQWLDPKTLVVANMSQNGQVLNGQYLIEEGHDFGGTIGAVKPTCIDETAVDASVLALAKTE